ncbi:MAG: M28 family peptidase [Gemmatimonadota bacterium]|nr:MAG: M28 family peptidase [Gemmatimonadota bacterium]
MIRPMNALALLGLVAVAAHPVFAQSRPSSPVSQALLTISEADFRAKLDALAHDSTRGRETPSPELERATDWVAGRFRDAGLTPAGDAGGFFQTFLLRHTQLDTLTTVTLAGPGYSATWALGREIVYAVGGLPVELRGAPVVLLAGIPTDTEQPFGATSVRGAVLLHVISPEQLSGGALNPLHRAAQAGGALAHIVVTEVPAEPWAAFVSESFPEWWEMVDGPDRSANQRLAVYGAQLAAAADLLRAAGADPAQLVAADRQDARLLSEFTVSVDPHYATLEESTVANVVGVLEGSDPTLRDEAVIFTGHMDHVGLVGGRCRPSVDAPADSTCNGADDNASGTVGVIELAEAYATLESRPARTLVFAAVTAEERGLFGSRFYVDHPVIPLERTVAVINLDMIARNPQDTVGFVGKDYTSLGALVDRLVGEHPELRLVPTEHSGRYGASDHLPFAQRGVPALFFFSGEHEDLHTPLDNPERADAEQASRIVRLAFLTGLEVANAPGRPTWDPEARAEVVER